MLYPHWKGTLIKYSLEVRAQPFRTLKLAVLVSVTKNKGDDQGQGLFLDIQEDIKMLGGPKL